MNHRQHREAEHLPHCPRAQFWDAGEWEAPCECYPSEDFSAPPLDIEIELDDEGMALLASAQWAEDWDSPEDSVYDR